MIVEVYELEDLSESEKALREQVRLKLKKQNHTCNLTLSSNALIKPFNIILVIFK